jgi:dipeptidase E
VDVVVVPHADGALPPYPPEVIEQTVERYGDAHRLVLLRDDQALLVEGAESLVVASA